MDKKIYVFNGGTSLYNSLLKTQGSFMECSHELNNHLLKLETKELSPIPLYLAHEMRDVYLRLIVEGVHG